MSDFNSHRGDAGTFSDDKARSDDKAGSGRTAKGPAKGAGKPVPEAPRKDPKEVPAGNPLHSGEHPDPRR